MHPPFILNSSNLSLSNFIKLNSESKISDSSWVGSHITWDWNWPKVTDLILFLICKTDSNSLELKKLFINAQTVSYKFPSWDKTLICSSNSQSSTKVMLSLNNLLEFLTLEVYQ